MPLSISPGNVLHTLHIYVVIMVTINYTFTLSTDSVVVSFNDLSVTVVWLFEW